MVSGDSSPATRRLTGRFAGPSHAVSGARGYTVFAIVHGSQPRFIIPEIEVDVHRAVRFYPFPRRGSMVSDPTGSGSPGPAPAVTFRPTLGTGAGPADAKDPIDRGIQRGAGRRLFLSPPTS